MKSLIKKPAATCCAPAPEKVAQCCAKISKNVAGCHD
jgi:hypothetical protein